MKKRNKTRLFVVMFLTLHVCAYSANAQTYYGSIFNDDIVIEPKTDYERVLSYQGKDQITISEGASLVWDEAKTFYSVSALNHTSIEAGSGDDIITNNGTIFLNTESYVSVSPLANSSSARSTGIDASSGDDIIENTDVITVNSKAAVSDLDTDTNEIESFLNNILNTILKNGEESVVNTACATSIGIDGGNGDNVIKNSGQLNVSSEAVESFGAVINKASAKATGILTGKGDDSINNLNALTVSSKATITPSTVSSNGGFVSVAIGKSCASAESIGIDSGSGDDAIINGHNLYVSSEAGSSRDAISANSSFFSAAKGFIDANAESTGISSGKGDDDIANKGTINVKASSEATINNVSSGSGFVAITMAKPHASAKSSGINSGCGDDIINSNIIDTSSIAKTEFKGNSAVLSGIASSCSTSSANAESVNIEAGEGNDTINAGGKMTSSASATAESVKSSVSFAGGSLGPAWSGGTNAEATAEGVNGGYGDDQISIGTGIDVTASATTTSDSGSATVAGVAMASSTSKAQSSTMCVMGGEGNDTVKNNGALTANAVSSAKSIETTVSGVGLSSGTIWDGGTVSEASSRGISTGVGDDTIENKNTIDVKGSSKVDTQSVSASLVGVAMSDTSTKAATEVQGIKSGLCDDTIDNQSTIRATANSETDSMSVSASLVGGATSVDGIWNGGTNASAKAYGIRGDSGNDLINNSGEIYSKATASSDAVRMTFSGGGFALSADSSWKGGTYAEAQATGIDGGWDNDIINNSATIDANSEAKSISSIGSMTVIGISSSVSSSRADAIAKGIDGNLGNDEILNTGEIKTKALAMVDQKSISASLAGASVTSDSMWDGGAIAKSLATGIDGGCGKDIIRNRGNITATSEAKANSSSTAITGIGVSLPEFSLWEASTKAESRAVGIDGKEMEDTIQNLSNITTTAKTEVNGKGTTVTLLGLGDSRTGIKGVSESTGIDGGTYGDTISNSGNLNVTTDVTADALNVNVNLVGIANGDVRTIVESTAKGIDGGSGKDEISNKGSIVVNSTSLLDATGTTVNLLGSATIDAKTVGDIHAMGIDGGKGNDTIQNGNTISVSASGTSESGAVSVNLVGLSGSKAGTELDIKATGIMGGEGDDTITNSGDIDTIKTTSTMNLNHTSFSLIGSASGKNALMASSTSKGIDGGMGKDTITNNKAIKVETHSTVASTGNSVVILGSSIDAGTVNPIANAIGIDGGGDDDTISNTGNITATSNSTALLKSDSFSLIGGTESKGSISAITKATGISGGDGNDCIENSGAVTVKTIANFKVEGSSTAIIGAAKKSAYAGTDTKTVGIDGEGGDDTIKNINAITVSSDAYVKLGANSFSFAGTSKSIGDLTAKASTTGIKGGDGKDTIENSGSISISSYSELESVGDSPVIFGSSTVGARVGTDSITTGIDGGAGDDTINNIKDISLVSISKVNLSNKSFSLGGAAGAQGNIIASSKATGIDGGAGNDVIKNSGSITIQAMPTLTGKSNATVVFGNATVDSAVQTGTLAIGIDGGTGDDQIENSGYLRAESISSVSLNNNSFSFGGGASGSNEVRATTTSIGILGGEDADTITNTGDIIASAASTIASTGKTRTVFGDNESATAIQGDSDAIGIHLGNGHNILENSGNITTNAATNASSSSNSNFGWFSDGSSQAKSKTFSKSAGIVSENGDNQILNEGVIHVGSTANANSNANSDGNVLTLFDGDAKAVTDAHADVTSKGIQLGAGNHTITNNGDISVIPQPVAWAYSFSNGDGADGDGYTYARAKTVTNTTGIEAGDGDTHIINNNLIKLDIRNITNAKTFVDADTGGDAISLAIAETTVDSHAIKLGNGNHTIENHGDIKITMEHAQAATSLGQSDGGNAEIADVDAFADARTHAYMNASGIKTGNGNQTIYNSGHLYIDAIIKGSGVSNADGDGIDGDGDSEAYTWAGARAWGIHIGTGDSTITNTGIISVRTRPEAYANAIVDSDAGGSSHGYSRSEVTHSEAYGILTGDGNQSITNTGRIEVIADAYAVAGSATAVNELKAVGIQTGSGNDFISNSGEINVRKINNGAQSKGIAVTTGAGNDALHIHTGATVFGSIDLGTGEDTLSFENTAAIYGLNTSEKGIAEGGAGIDSLIFNGAGSNHASLNNFERAVKNGTGVYNVNSLSSMDKLDINNGTLHINNSYAMKNNSETNILLHSSTEHGQLKSDGEITVDGKLTATRTSGAFAPGDVMDIIVAKSVNGSFDDITVPESTPLLDFHYDQESDRAQIEVTVKSFTTVAKTENEMEVATYLDKMLPTAEGSLNEAIGAVQKLSQKDFQKAFYNISPSAYLKGAIVTKNNNFKYAKTVQNRMDNKRTLACLNTKKDKPVLLAYNGNDVGQFTGETPKEKSKGVWGNVFGQWGEQDTNVTGYDYNMAGAAMGCDYTILDGVLIGAGIGYSLTDIESKGSEIESDIKTVSLSGYGSYLFDKAYVESVISVGKGTFDMERSDGISGTKTSSHDMDIVSFLAGFGYYHRKNDYLMTPFTSFHYMNLYQERFRESGDSGTLLENGPQSTDHLSMEIGMTVSRIFDKKAYFLIPEISLSWNHDFDLDENTITSHFTEATQSDGFTTSEETEKDSAIIGAGIKILTDAGFTTSLSFTTEVKKDYTAFGVLADVRYAF